MQILWLRARLSCSGWWRVALDGLSGKYRIKILVVFNGNIQLIINTRLSTLKMIEKRRAPH